MTSNLPSATFSFATCSVTDGLAAGMTLIILLMPSSPSTTAFGRSSRRSELLDEAMESRRPSYVFRPLAPSIESNCYRGCFALLMDGLRMSYGASWSYWWNPDSFTYVDCRNVLIRAISAVDNSVLSSYHVSVTEAVVAEWLRRWTWNPMGSPRAGSNPAGCVKLLSHSTFVFLTLNTNILWTLLSRGRWRAL